MLLDVSFTNLYLENLGTSIATLFNLTNLITFENGSFNFDNIFKLINFLNLWPTTSQLVELTNNVLFIDCMFDNYFDTIKNVSNLTFPLVSLDYLHLFYLKQTFYKIVISSYSDADTSIIKNITLSLHLDIFFSQFMNKWNFVIITFAITYFFSNIMKFRYQYGFNFYFSYFKTLADLGEQEYGSYDDYKFFLFFLVQMLVWYCWIFFVGYTFSLQSESKLVLLTISVMITILSIPVRLLWDFGLAFGMYIRGASSSSNLIVEAFFDIIGVIIIFTRFVVQNIRFLLVFVAFFELFEWTATSTDLNYIIQINNGIFADRSIYMFTDPKAFFICLLVSIKTGFVYLYHLLHLIIVSFMQIGVYLMVSFWLFFFLYTSFFKITLDTYFSIKRN